MLRSIVVLFLGLSLSLWAQTKEQKEFMQYCMHEANEAQVHTIMVAADEPTRERSCNYLIRYLVPIDSRRAIRLRNSNITDITPLAQLTELTDVDLGGNPITEIKSLLGLKKLKELSLYSTKQLEDISPPLYSLLL
jgi:hypothetical protein